MWRFILISFGFLGFAFYELSGGADYAPSPDSLQVAMRDKPLFASPSKSKPAVQVADAGGDNAPADTPDPQQAETPPPAEHNKAARAQTPFAGRSGIDEDAHDGFEITLASVSSGRSGGTAMGEHALNQVGTFSAETLVQDVRNTPIDQALVAAQKPADIREIEASEANMRSGPGTNFEKVAQLASGAVVEVLDRRGAWIELREVETGQTGWMADWLVTAAN